MERGTEGEALVEAWARHAGAREKRTFGIANLLICILVPAWSIFDFLLEPELAPRFFVLRCADVVLTIGIWMFLARSNHATRNRSAMCLSVIAVGLMVASMLPRVPDHYALYTFGFSLVFWGCGLLLLWPLPWVLTSFAVILVGHVVFHFSLSDDRIPLHDFIGSLFYLGSAAIISGAQHVLRLRLERDAFRASFTLEQQNAELACALGELEATQKRLGATATALTESLELETAAQRVVDIAIPRLASWALLMVRFRGEETVRAIAHADVELRLRVGAALPASDLPFDRVHATERVVDASPSDVGGMIGSALAALLDARSLLAAPLSARGERIGVLFFGRIDRNYAPNECVFIEELADRGAVALDNARLFQETQRAVRARDNFISIAGHELRTPLTALRLNIDALLATSTDERTLGALQRAERQGRRLTGLIEQLLDVARIAEGCVVLEPEDLELADVVEEVVNRFRPEAERARSPLEVNIHQPGKGRWDRSRVDQVLSNLVSNAIKYGAGTPIRISLIETPSAVQLRVQDEGIGIDESDQARIFERFGRADSARNFGGIGLGLWITKSLVEQMRGSIRVESEVKKGATFVIELPRNS